MFMNFSRMTCGLTVPTAHGSVVFALGEDELFEIKKAKHPSTPKPKAGNEEEAHPSHWRSKLQIFNCGRLIPSGTSSF